MVFGTPDVWLKERIAAITYITKHYMTYAVESNISGYCANCYLDIKTIQGCFVI